MLPENCLAACREITNAIYEGLDVSVEILSVAGQDLGGTVFVRDGPRLEAFAVCHTGAGSEAGSGVCNVKFGAVRPGPDAGENFDRLLDACEAFGASRGAKRLAAGGNTARIESYRRMLARGMRTETTGLIMETPETAPGYNRAGVYLLDDWR